jgi:hypothetical protein
MRRAVASENQIILFLAMFACAKEGNEPIMCHLKGDDKAEDAEPAEDRDSATI